MAFFSGCVLYISVPVRSTDNIFHPRHNAEGSWRWPDSHVHAKGNSNANFLAIRNVGELTEGHGSWSSWESTRDVSLNSCAAFCSLNVKQDFPKKPQ